MATKFCSRGGDPNIESFYTTEYSSRYQRPSTTACISRGITSTNQSLTSNLKSSGFSGNGHVSPLLLNKIDDSEKWVSSSHAAHSQNSTVFSLMQPRAMSRSTMERSGYWNEPEPGSLNQTPFQRAQNKKSREINPTLYPEQTLKQMAKKNSVEAENGGNGPEWGSTTSGQAFQKHESSHDRYWKTKKELIGKKEHNGFTRQHLTINETPIAEQVSTAHSSYRPPPQPKGPVIPSNTIVEASGFTRSQKPTINHTRLLSDVTADQLHPTELNRLKHKNTPEYQNLYNPDPWISTAHISYQVPVKERAATAKTVRRATTGYGHNENVTAGIPGDARTFKTGVSETMKKFTDPHEKLRAQPPMVPNVVERSGFWC